MQRKLLHLVSAALLLPSLSLAATRKISGTIDPGQVVPPIAADAGATGAGTLSGTYDDMTKNMTLHVEYTGLNGVNGGALHQGAKGATGPVIFPVSVPNTDAGPPDDAGVAFDQNFLLTTENAVELLGDRVYLNIRTGGRPAGALRGQLIAEKIDSGIVTTGDAGGGDASIASDSGTVSSGSSGETGGGGCSSASESGWNGAFSLVGVGFVLSIAARRRRNQRVGK
jgi:CHRD domain